MSESTENYKVHYGILQMNSQRKHPMLGHQLIFGSHFLLLYSHEPAKQFQCQELVSNHLDSLEREDILSEQILLRQGSKQKANLVPKIVVGLQEFIVLAFC